VAPNNPIQAGIQALIQHLEHREQRGEPRIYLTPEVRQRLGELPANLRQRSSQAAPSPSPVAAKPVRTPAAAPTKVAQTTVKEEPRPQPKTEDPAQPAAASPDGRLVPQGNTRREKLVWLRKQAENWPPVQELDTLRDTMVFAVGNPNADLMFVGEAPGGEEERRREPFVGPAGQLLTKIIQAMGLARKEVYISNIVKYRPALPNQGESNRKPTAQEMAACLPIVEAEVAVVEPKVIVALGGTAMEGLLKIEKGVVSRARAQFHDFKGIPLMVTYHPSYLLRNQDVSERRKVWEDLMMVMERLGMPISDKQRRFFLKSG